MGRMVSFGVLLAIIVVIGLLFYKVMVGFFVPVFLAAVLCVVFRPLHRWVLEKLGNRERIAAAVTTLLILLSVLLPAGLILAASAVQGASLVQDVNATSINLGFQRMRNSLGLGITHAEEIRKLQADVDQLVELGNDNQSSDIKSLKLKQLISRIDLE